MRCHDNSYPNLSLTGYFFGVFTSHGEWVFGSKRVNRTKNWKNSIKTRISELEERLQKQQESYKCAPEV